MKDVLISHVGDIDGVSPVILMRLCEIDFDYYLFEVQELDMFLKQFLKEDLSLYNHIYITDLCPDEEIISLIDKSPYRDKFLIFDHHITRKYAEKYDFVTMNYTACGTSLFYEYLKKNYTWNENVDVYVDHVKDLDLWLWEKKENTVAKALGDLFTIYGKEKYIEKMITKLSQNSVFKLDCWEEEILELEQDRILRYIEKKEEKMITFVYENYHVGCIFAEQYKSEIGSILSEKYPILDFIVIINASGGISFRTKKDNIDVSLVAKNLGGGGHKKASGIAFPDELKEYMITDIFKGAILDEK